MVEIFIAQLADHRRIHVIRRETLVAGRATAQHFRVVDADGRHPARRRVAGLADVRARNVIRRLPGFYGNPDTARAWHPRMKPPYTNRS